ncbi:MAG: hypothetical protein JXQ96_17685 [Cyclobacteriaceae bacterium]
MKEKIKKELWVLHRKADQTRSIHGQIKQKYDTINTRITLFITIGSAIAAMLIFAEIPNVYKYIGGFLSAIIFIVSLIPGSMKYENRIQERAVAVKLWGDWTRNARDFCNVEIEEISDKKAKVQHKLLIESYKKVMESTPDIPDEFFNEGKRNHLQKVEISKELDKSPFKTIEEIKKELKNR